MFFAKRMFLLGLVFAMGGCATRPAPDAMNRIASSLTKLSAAVDAVVRYDDLPPDASDSLIWKKVQASNPSLLGDFDGYSLKLTRVGVDSEVLVCDGAGRIAFLEDAGCTAKLDLHHWSREASVPCEQVLSLKEVCASK